MNKLHQLATAMKSDGQQLFRAAGRNLRLQSALGWIGIENGNSFNHDVEGIPVPGTVIVYFGDEPDKIYQLLQWIPVLERLHLDHSVVLLFRKVESFRMIRKHTNLPRIFVRRFTSLMDLYEDNRYQMVIYVNNSRTNFQSLEHPHPVHVHVNHGESDKLSMVSNKAKAYDKVFVAGPAAIARHKARLIDFDFEKLVVTGRPQLDVDFEPTLSESELRTVMYAPTWEGENYDNNYTSVDVYGLSIARALMSMKDTRLIYKPHPRVADSRNVDVRQAHERICGLIERNRERGANHEYVPAGNILSMFDPIDALVTDISSVGLDFLYLCVDKPLILTDRRGDIRQLHEDAPVSSACQVVNQAGHGSLDTLLEAWIEDDEMVDERLRARELYFGGLARGDSTERFYEQVSGLMAERQSKLPKPRAGVSR
jgi:hypothetical protein